MKAYDVGTKASRALVGGLCAELKDRPSHSNGSIPEPRLEVLAIEILMEWEVKGSSEAAAVPCRQTDTADGVISILPPCILATWQSFA